MDNIINWLTIIIVNSPIIALLLFTLMLIIIFFMLMFKWFIEVVNIIWKDIREELHI